MEPEHIVPSQGPQDWWIELWRQTVHHGIVSSGRLPPPASTWTLDPRYPDRLAVEHLHAADMIILLMGSPVIELWKNRWGDVKHRLHLSVSLYEELAARGHTYLSSVPSPRRSNIASGVGIVFLTTAPLVSEKFQGRK